MEFRRVLFQSMKSSPDSRISRRRSSRWRGSAAKSGSVPAKESARSSAVASRRVRVVRLVSIAASSAWSTPDWYQRDVAACSCTSVNQAKTSVGASASVRSATNSLERRLIARASLGLRRQAAELTAGGPDLAALRLAHGYGGGGPRGGGGARGGGRGRPRGPGGGVGGDFFPLPRARARNPGEPVGVLHA